MQMHSSKARADLLERWIYSLGAIADRVEHFILTELRLLVNQPPILNDERTVIARHLSEKTDQPQATAVPWE